MTKAVDDLDPRDPLMTGLRGWSFAHPRARWFLREGWGLARRGARAVHLPLPFEPVEFDDLRAVRDSAAPPSAGRRPRVLFLSFRGWSTHLLWETTFAHAVAQRGGEAVFATCGGRLPICDVTTAHAAPPMPCLSCGEYAEQALAAAGFTPHTVRSLVSIGDESRAARSRLGNVETVPDCEEFMDGDMPIGQLVRVSVAWFLARGTLPDSGPVRETYKRFLVSGQVLHRAFTRLLDETRPERVVVLNGAFFAERILAELAQRHGIPVTSYERGFLADSLILTQHPSCDLEIEDEFWEVARDVPLTAEEDARLDTYLGGRMRGEGQTDDFWKHRVEDWGQVCAELGLEPDRAKVALFTNVVWDSAVQGRECAFPSMNQWVIEAIRGFADRPDYDLVVRLHPAELSGNHKTEERMATVIEDAFPDLPPNVRIIGPTNPASSYSLMAVAQIGLVYASTVGLEMAIQGAPVVVSALTHYRGHGFTHDAASPSDFWEHVDGLLKVSPTEPERRIQQQLARRYANLFFFRFMQRFSLVTEARQSRPRLTYRDVAQLAPGQDDVLDRVADGMLRGSHVMAPAADPPRRG